MKPGFSPTGSVNLVCYHGILQGPSPVTALDFLYLELATSNLTGLPAPANVLSRSPLVH